MDTGELHRPLYCADILINALSQDPTRPLLHLLDGPTLTVGEVRDATSQFVQALRSLGSDPGAAHQLYDVGSHHDLRPPRSSALRSCASPSTM